MLQQAVSQNQVKELKNLVHELLDKQENEIAKKTVKFENTEDALQFLQGQISIEKFKLRVIPEHALEEAIRFFKDQDSDMNLKVTVTFKGQSAVGTGGVLRQYYSIIFEQMVTGCDLISPIFEGCERRKLTVFKRWRITFRSNGNCRKSYYSWNFAGRTWYFMSSAMCFSLYCHW